LNSKFDVGRICIDMLEFWLCYDVRGLLGCSKVGDELDWYSRVRTSDDFVSLADLGDWSYFNFEGVQGTDWSDIVLKILLEFLRNWYFS
jgi:hypothetical protein